MFELRPLSPVQSLQRATLSVKWWLKILTYWQSKIKNARKRNKKLTEDFLGGSVVKNLPAKATHSSILGQRSVAGRKRVGHSWGTVPTHTFQWRGHRFDHGSGKIPRAAGQLSTHMATAEARRSHLSEKPVHGNWRVASAHCNYRKPACSSGDPAQSKISKNK